MTLKELMEKNARVQAERAMVKKLEKAIKEAKVEPAPIVEETPHIIEAVKEEPVAEEKLEEEKAEEAEVKPAPKKGKKPANRAYMVVENIPEEEK